MNTLQKKMSPHRPTALAVPNLISLLRLPLAVSFPLTHEHPRSAIAILVLAAATDIADGWYARRFHQATATGAIVDGVMDKVFVFTVMTSMIAYGSLTFFEAALLATRELGELPLLLYWVLFRRVASAAFGDLPITSGN